MLDYLPLLVIILLTGMLAHLLAQPQRDHRTWLLIAYFATGLAEAIAALISSTSPAGELRALTLVVAQLALGIAQLPLTLLFGAVFFPKTFAEPGALARIGAMYVIGYSLSFGLALSSLGEDTVDELNFSLLAASLDPAFSTVAYLLGALLPIGLLAVVVLQPHTQRRDARVLLAGMVATALLLIVLFLVRQLAFVPAALLPFYAVLAFLVLRSPNFRPSVQALQAAVATLDESVLLLDDTRIVRYANPAAAALLGTDVVGAPLAATMHTAGLIHAPTPQSPGRMTREDQVFLVFEAAIANDSVAKYVVLIRNITSEERRAREVEQAAIALSVRSYELEQLLEEIHERDQLIVDLALPLIPIGSDVLVMPLIGRFDAQRSQALLVRLLHTVEAQGARLVLFDMTGVTNFDDTLAATLARAVNGARMMGTGVALCGIRPELAESMIHETLDLHNVQIFPTLADGVAHTALTRSLPRRAVLRQPAQVEPQRDAEVPV